jgi:L-lactate dehydrogenase (cytochrome)
MKHTFNTEYPSIDFLREKAKSKIPGFAFDYLEGGCNEEVNLKKNTSELREVELVPDYLSKHSISDLRTELFGHIYDAPFGIAPIGLQGLIWPKTPEILARAAFKHNIPFILSTVSTASIETISEITEGQAWFQLYHPTQDTLRDKLINRAAGAGCPVLVILCDVPSFGFRYNDIRNGLGMPPKMSVRNFLQILSKPDWALRTLINGQPGFANIKPYMPKNINLKQLGLFMNETFSGRLNEEKIKPIRDMWKGKIVLKGVAGAQDTERAIKLGLDGIIISNHGGRQLDAGESTIKVLPDIKAKYGDKIKVMMDSGLRSGPDIARTLASGADFTFLGRSFMYGAAALGNQGGDHTISILKIQLQQVMEQICCEKVKDFPKFLKR